MVQCKMAHDEREVDERHQVRIQVTGDEEGETRTDKQCTEPTIQVTDHKQVNHGDRYDIAVLQRNVPIWEPLQDGVEWERGKQANGQFQRRLINTC